MNDLCNIMSKLIPYKPPSVKGYTFEKPYPQRFPYPTYMMKYIALNQLSVKLWQKLVKSCKYFYSKNPVIVCDNFSFNENGVIHFSVKKKFYTVKIDEMKYKIWLTGWTWTEKFSIIVFSTKIYRNDIKTLSLFNNMMILFDDLKILGCSKNLESLGIISSTVKDRNGGIVTVEEIAEAFPNLLFLNYRCCPENVLSITQKTAEKLLQIFPSTGSFFDEKRITTIHLDNLPEQFQFELIIDYIMQKQPLISFTLSFQEHLSADHTERLKFGVNKILASKKTIFPYQEICYIFWEESALKPLYSSLYQRCIIYSWKCIKYRRSIKKWIS